ncbi:ergosterol biosynthesis ERG4/ERG24 [Cladochytrium replicatum]|nr:ergosterol biosynthesis ERG4/ERG24 [Cladochytrium replicatum]
MAVSEDLKQRKGVSKKQRQPTDAKKGEDNVVAQTGQTWGRTRDVPLSSVIGVSMIMAFCPLLVLYFWSACTYDECRILGPALKAVDDPQRFLKEFFPVPTNEGFALYFGWLLFQGLCYAFVPAKVGYGQTTPAGLTLPYVVNGLRVWVITHALYILGSDLFLNLYPLTLIYDHWPALLVAANCYGYFLTFFTYAKAHLFPSHPADRKFSGSAAYDLFFGIEFNPRLGKLWDFKLFHNGRPGIVAWTLINLSFAAAQAKILGRVTNSMVLVNILHVIYVVDFFWNEDWYLRTIDIAHDHFGFYLAWGDSVWLPWMYTLQSHFLVRHPTDLSTPTFLLVLGLGLGGYAIFRAANNQKDLARRTNGDCKIWGRPARVVRTQFQTSDGKVHTSILLASGFWGISRHFNYVGDLMISAAMCWACGAHEWILPQFYLVYMTILLVHRIERDHQRLVGKYGKYWEEYCGVVRYKLIPYVY